MRRILLILTVTLTGCATALTTQGASVVLVQNRTDHNCTFIDTVSGSNTDGKDMAHDADGAMNQLRNKASQINANAVRVLSINSNEDGTTVIGEALKCNF
jgi:uncharacterized protein YbjQ (UPF0145 family)